RCPDSPRGSRRARRDWCSRGALRVASPARCGLCALRLWPSNGTAVARTAKTSRPARRGLLGSTGRSAIRTRATRDCEVRTMLEVSITRGQAMERPQAPRWITAALLGAGLTYLFDPVSGRRRRARVRDLGAHWARLSSVAVRKTRTDLEHRARGILAIARARARGDEDVSDETLVARVRARLGTAVSHPHAVDVEAHEGTVVLRGPILEHEAHRALRAVRRLRGVRAIDDRLERHASSENVPALQGGVERRRRPEILQENWTPAVRLLAGAAGVALLARGARPEARSGVAVALGVGLFLRAATNLPVRRMLGLRSKGKKAIVLQKSIHVEATPEELFQVFRNARALPRFMSHLASVEVDGQK